MHDHRFEDALEPAAADFLGLEVEVCGRDVDDDRRRAQIARTRDGDQARRHRDAAPEQAIAVVAHLAVVQAHAQLGPVVGLDDGFTVGDVVGCSDGAREGSSLGPLVGPSVGSTEGIEDGFVEGCVVGPEEGVVDGPTELDLATVFGMGFAPFRGGLLHYADTLGVPEIVRRLERMATAADVSARPGGTLKFTPAASLVEMADAGRGFFDEAPATSGGGRAATAVAQPA